MPTPDDWLTRGLDRHRAGDLDGAETLYRQALLVNPNHAVAWQMLGVVQTHRGRPEQALELIGRAITLAPHEGPFYLNLGVAHQALGRMAEAEACFRQAVQRAPRLAQAHNNLANALYARGATAEARTHWEVALGLDPGYAEAHYNLASALSDAGETESAIDHLQLSLRSRPDFAPGYIRLGTALLRVVRPPEAAEAFRQALRLRPDDIQALCGLAHSLRRLDDPTGAESCLLQAVHLAPGSFDAHNMLGELLAGLGRLDEALEHFRKAVKAAPTDADGHYNLGEALQRRRQLAPAEFHLREALRLRPDFLDAYRSLAHVVVQQGRIDDALELCEEAIRRAPESAALQTAWGDVLAQAGRVSESAEAFREAVRLDPKAELAHGCLLNTLQFHPDLTPAELLAEHRIWAEAHLNARPSGPAPGHDRDPGRRLRVGYLSPDFRQHVLHHFLEPVLAHHDPREVEVFAYADVVAPDAVTARLRGLVRHWRSLCGLPDEAVARQVLADRIDLLVDLGGHTGTRLGVFARRPAPVQLTWLGYPGTTGLEAIRYRLTDAVADPPGEPVCHTEELVRLPDGFCCYDPPCEAPEVGPLPAAGAGFVTFGGLHKLAKYNGRVFDLWCAVLRALPSARLLLFRDGLRGPTADRLREEFVRRGIPADRVRLEHLVDHPSFLAVYRQIDVSLDTLPWSGHATACEALWMGVPTLTLLGDRHAGRMVASVLTGVGLPEFVTPTPAEFVARAVSLAGDLDWLAGLRAGLRDRVRSSPLGDAATFTRRLEVAYRQLWRRWACPGEFGRNLDDSASTTG
jgi:predicted O-linked N-acetylglucosamine transferase (SPINDLY family)